MNKQNLREATETDGLLTFPEALEVAKKQFNSLGFTHLSDYVLDLAARCIVKWQGKHLTQQEAYADSIITARDAEAIRKDFINYSNFKSADVDSCKRSFVAIVLMVTK